MSPTIIRSTGVFSNIGVQPRIILFDLSNKSHILSDSQELRYINSDNYINNKSCHFQTFIRKKLFFLSLNTIFNECSQTSYCDQSSGEYKVNSMHHS